MYHDNFYLGGRKNCLSSKRLQSNLKEPVFVLKIRGTSTINQSYLFLDVRAERFFHHIVADLTGDIRILHLQLMSKTLLIERLVKT